MENLEEKLDENNNSLNQKAINGYFLYKCKNCIKSYYSQKEKIININDQFCSKDCYSSFKINEYLKENDI